MLATAMRLARDPAPGSANAAWRQIVDILAQAGDRFDDDARTVAVAELDRLRSAVPVADRRLAAASLAGRTADIGVVAIFGADLPGVAAPVLAGAKLDGAAWEHLIPGLPAASRNILRNRRDLPETAVALLGRYASGDLALPDNTPTPEETASGVTQIRDLVDRIAAYRQRAPRAAPEPAAVDDTGFVFETTLDGVIDWVEGCAREAVVGLSIAEPAPLGAGGVDGQAVGAWRRRAPVSDARLLVGGVGSAAGDWLISATPLFNPADGRFCGYRGTARRPGPGDRSGGEARMSLDPDALRQLVHELRTPLNAVQGFAQMIDRQMLGPAALRYRERARAIVADTERLVTMVEDLDAAARLDAGRVHETPATSSGFADLVERAVSPYRSVLATRGVELATVHAATSADAECAGAARMIDRLVAAVAGVAGPGEVVRLETKAGSDTMSLSLPRPNALIGRGERQLLDPGQGDHEAWPDAPLLGLGFTLRLISRMAREAGGRLVILADRFELILPRVTPSVRKMVGPVGFEPTT